MSIHIPENPYDPSEDKNSFVIKQYWRMIWLVPILVSILQTILLLTFFRFETPKMMKARGDDSALVKLMSRAYKKEHVAQRIEKIEVPRTENNGSSADDVTYMQTLFDPTIRKSTWVGINLSMF